MSTFMSTCLLFCTGQTHYLHPGRDYVVGRKNCDILLTSDQSISRAHAQLVPSAQVNTRLSPGRSSVKISCQAFWILLLLF